MTLACHGSSSLNYSLCLYLTVTFCHVLVKETELNESLIIDSLPDDSVLWLKSGVPQLASDDLNFAVQADLDDLGGQAGGSGFETWIYSVVRCGLDLFRNVCEFLRGRLSGDVG